MFGEVYSKPIKVELPLAQNKVIHFIDLYESINDSVNGAILLNLDNHSTTGFFDVSDDTVVDVTFLNYKADQKITLKGVLNEETLNIEEYADGNVLTGYFEGELIEKVYTGNCISLDRKTQVLIVFKTK